jgi:hypothetical protein
MKETVGWHALITRPITGPGEALAFINECGFCTWGPVPRLPFPNLAEAMGETATSVLERTWSWKDDLHFAQQIYYGKIIAGKPSFLAPDYLSDFIAAMADSLGKPRPSTTGYSIILPNRRGNSGVASSSAINRRSWRPNARWWNCNVAS